MGVRNGGDRRGSNADRAARRKWLVSPVAGTMTYEGWKSFGGNGKTVPCWWSCGRELTELTVEADRLVAGGSYRRDNIVPACRPCNLARSDKDTLSRMQIAERVRETVQRTGRLVPDLAR